MRDVDDIPSVMWSDRDIADYARKYARVRCLQVVHVPLAFAVSDGEPDTAEVTFSRDTIAVRRYKNRKSS